MGIVWEVREMDEREGERGTNGGRWEKRGAG